jgi:hypothetical protein
MPEYCRELWGFGDMMRFTAAGLFTSLLWLGHVNTEAAFGSFSDEELFEKYRKALCEVRIDAERCQLTSVIQKIDLLLTTWLKEDNKAGMNDMNIVVAMVANFVGDVQSELKNHLYFRIAKEERSFYDEVQLTEAAANAFPSTVPEIRNAGRCFALDQPTAVVLHSMRTLEIPLRGLVNTLNFTPSNPNWQNVINECEREIKKLTDRSKQEFYSAAAANFLYFKNAWRNHAMHGRDSYDKREAYEIFTHVSGFMNHLALKISEAGEHIP